MAASVRRMPASALDLEHVARRVTQTLRGEDWAGWDPYDALSSPLAQRLTTNRARQAWVQLHKRSPVNLRRYAGVRPHRMVKTAAVVLLAAGRSTAVRESVGDAEPALRHLVAGRLRRDGDLAWWGYEFPVQTRWAHYPAGAPNAVVTAFAVEALLASPASDDGQLLEPVGRYLASSIGSSGQGTYFRYVPQSSAMIHNASALSAAALASIASRIGAKEWLDLAFEAGVTIMNAQQPDGGWPYGDGPALAWQDGFHTMYTLLALERLRTLGLREAEGAITSGVKHALRDFVQPDGSVRYYRDGRPIADAHNSGTMIRGLVDLRHYDGAALPTAHRCAAYVVPRLWQERRGHFAHRSGYGCRVPVAYPRWSDSHMLLALASLLDTAIRI